MTDEGGCAAGGEAAAAGGAEQCRGAGDRCLGGATVAAGSSSLPRGERLCTTFVRARSQMVVPPRTAWVAFGQRYPSSRLTMTAIALMTNSGSHMPLIIPSFAF